MWEVGVFNEGHSSSIAIGLSKECKSVFNMACTMPWCHTVVRFEVKMSHFRAAFHENCPNRGSTSAKQAVFLGR